MIERIINLYSELTYLVDIPTTILLKVAAMNTPHQSISDELLTVNPSTSVQTGR